MKDRVMRTISSSLRLSLCTMTRLWIQQVTKGRVMILKNASVNAARTSKIVARNGVFIINNRWAPRDPFPFLLVLRKNAKIIVEGSFSIYSGARVYVNEGAALHLGSGYINNGLNLSCFGTITIGNDVAISENVCIRDSDNHDLLDGCHQKTQPIAIGNRVWIGMNVTILKGVSIGDGSVVAAGALVNRDVPANCMVGGVPAKVIKQNVQWN
jgi:acetyltransferase-like isoleucine patch superfamily enzyme